MLILILLLVLVDMKYIANTLIDIPTNKLNKNSHIKTVIINPSIDTEVMDSSSKKDNNEENSKLFDVLKPIAKSVDKHKEYYYNPPAMNNVTKMFELPPIMQSVRSSIRRRLAQKLETKLHKARQRRLNLLGKIIQSLKPSRSQVNIQSFYKFNNTDNDVDKDTVLGFKSRQENFFKIIENKRTNVEHINTQGRTKHKK